MNEGSKRFSTLSILRIDLRTFVALVGDCLDEMVGRQFLALFAKEFVEISGVYL